MRASVFILMMALTAACASDPTQWAGDPPSLAAARVYPSDGGIFRLQLDEVAASEDRSLLVAFRGVRSDSRCPATVTCVWAGNAEVLIGTARDGGRWTWFRLNTGIDPRQANIERYTVTLVDLEPAARESERIPANEYVAVLRIDPE